MSVSQLEIAYRARTISYFTFPPLRESVLRRYAIRHSACTAFHVFFPLFGDGAARRGARTSPRRRLRTVWGAGVILQINLPRPFGRGPSRVLRGWIINLNVNRRGPEGQKWGAALSQMRLKVVAMKADDSHTRVWQTHRRTMVIEISSSSRTRNLRARLFCHIYVYVYSRKSDKIAGTKRSAYNPEELFLFVCCVIIFMKYVAVLIICIAIILPFDTDEEIRSFCGLK